MNTIIKLIQKDFIRFIKDKPAVLLTFLVPIVLIIIFANLFSSDNVRGKTPVVLVNSSSSFVAKYIETTLDSSKTLLPVKTYKKGKEDELIKIDEEKAKELVRNGNYSAALVLRKNFFTDTTSSLRFKFYFDPKSEIESAIIQGEIQKTVMTQAGKLFPTLLQKKANSTIGFQQSSKFSNEMNKLISGYFNVPLDNVMNSYGKLDSASLFSNSQSGAGSSDFMSDIVKFDSEQLVGKELSNPGLTRTVGGWAIMFLLFTITGAASSMFEEKSEGTLKRILCMPVNRTQILWSKYIYSMLVGIIQLCVLFLFAWAFYKVDIFSNFFNLMIMIILSSAAAVAFGMIITSFATSIAQANGFATLIILIMSALGGSWFPVTFFPDWLQTVAKFTLTYWSVEGFLQVLWRQSSIVAILPHIAILSGIAIVINFYSVIRFKKGKVF